MGVFTGRVKEKRTIEEMRAGNTLHCTTRIPGLGTTRFSVVASGAVAVVDPVEQMQFPGKVRMGQASTTKDCVVWYMPEDGAVIVRIT